MYETRRMSIQFQSLWLRVLIPALLCHCQVSAHGDSGERIQVDTYVKPLKASIFDHWALSAATLPGKVVIQAGIADDGNIYDAEVKKSAGDLQLDNECLEAVCGESPFAQKPQELRNGMLVTFQITFNKDDKAVQNAVEISEFKKIHPLGIVFHRIPLSIAMRYPNILTNDELNSAKNLRAAGNGNVVPVYARWSDFFASHKTTTKKEILSACQIIDYQF